jgi:hypothetical protein
MNVEKYLKIVLYGCLLWLVAFLVSVALSPIRETQRALFESIMPVVIALGTVFFSIIYLRKREVDFLQEGVLLGVIWFALNIGLDLPLFLRGPMAMPLSEYVKDIGLTYLIIPVITVGFGYLLENKILEG